MNQSQFNYLVSPSPWPILTANSLLLITSGFNNTFVLFLVKIFSSILKIVGSQAC
jgi:hypothetical protein